MEIIELDEDQLISDCELIKITIGEYEGNWALKTATVITRGGQVCHRDESYNVRGDYYHEDEFTDYDIVYDEYYERYEYESDCYFGYVGNDTTGYFNTESDYVSYGDDFFISREVAANHGIFYCCDCEMDYHRDYGCDCPDIDEDNDEESDDIVYCFDYHSKYREDFSKESIYKIGFEVEKEDRNIRDDVLAIDLFDDTGWAKERDGSLGIGGFELVSPILPLDITKSVNQQPDIINSINSVESYINARYTRKCGGHINISRQNISSQELLRSIGGYLPLFYSLYQNRVENGYSPAKSLRRYIEVREKYSSFNCKNDGIIEVRIFPAVMNVANLLWRTELLRIILSNPTENYKTALVKIANPKNELHQHLAKIFDRQKLFEKVKLFVNYAAQFEQVQFKQKTINHNLGKIYKVA